MKSFEFPSERMLMYEDYNRRLENIYRKNQYNSDTCNSKLVNYGKKIKKLIRKK